MHSKKGEISDYIGRDMKKHKVIRGPGQPKKKVMSSGVPGGMGAEQFDRRIMASALFDSLMASGRMVTLPPKISETT